MTSSHHDRFIFCHIGEYKTVISGHLCLGHTEQKSVGALFALADEKNVYLFGKYNADE